jgi:hypothetical protein
VRVRGARAGNRQLNAAPYRIAIFQIRHNGPSDAYYRRRREDGDTPAEAMRRVERRIARTVFTLLRKDDLGRAGPTTWSRRGPSAEGSDNIGSYRNAARVSPSAAMPEFTATS